MRKIIHVDMDCFFAAVEMRDNPALRDIPIAIGGSRVQRGVISTANYPARKFGVRSAMPTAMALKLCPHLTLLPGRFEAYKEASLHIREIFSRYTSLIEPLSLDEAYLDVTDSVHCHGSATLMAQEIRRTIFQELNLTASAGVAPVKFLAKIASDLNKPDGQYVITPEEVPAFLKTLPLGKIPGVGKVSAAKLESMGLRTGETHPWRGKGVTIPTLKSVLETWPQTRFYIDIKSPDADPATMGKALLAVLNETQSLGRVRVYSTEDRYLASLSAAIPRFVTRSETRSRLVTVSLSHQCLPPEQTMQEYWYALELNRTVDVVEKFTLGEGVSRSTLTWDKESMDCFRSQGNSHVILLGVNTAEDYKKAEALQADAVMVDSPAAAKAWAK